jgi:hypothetical protein
MGGSMAIVPGAAERRDGTKVSDFFTVLVRQGDVR